ncbi:MAG: prephenate dehydrogenase [Spirochaetaceae bacterium]|nr:prephenate dehydrogenase [Spirochaetaceae bacterium]
MGGSFAKAIRQNILNVPNAKGDIVACDTQNATLSQAKNDGIISCGYSPSEVGKMLAICDVVFVCLYPKATLDFIKAHRMEFKSGAVVTDISGVKSQIITALPQILREDVDFISGHPMAGGEKEGYVHASGAVFVGRNYILMPLSQNKIEHLDFFRHLVTSIGFTRIIETDATIHDHKIAFTSQLCHVIASALVDSAEDTNVTAFGGGSFEDLTRIAMINAPLWTELFAANKKELLTHIDTFIDSMEKIRGLLVADNTESMCHLLEDVRQKRIAMARIDVGALP